MTDNKYDQWYVGLLRVGVFGLAVIALLLCFPIHRRENPVSRYKVLLISGHVKTPTTKMDGRGAISYSGKFEYEFNDALIESFKEKSYRVNGVSYDIIIMRAADNIGLKARVQSANEIKPDFYIEIHHDSAQPGDISKARRAGNESPAWQKISGFSTHYSESNLFPEESKKLAELFGDEMLKLGFKPNLYHADVEKMKCADRKRGIYNRVDPKGLYVLYHATVPSIVIECGTIVNPHEENLMSKKDTQLKIVTAINNALAKYFRIKSEFDVSHKS